MRIHVMAPLAAMLALGCGAPKGSPSDSAFADVQRRGATVMGVDQYASQHVFESLADGGRIVLQRDDAADTTAIRTIREHMRDIVKDFREGDFAKPFQVHAREVPGTDVMAARRAEITYSVEELPRGAAVRIVATTATAVAAIHDFLAFQREDHRAGHMAH